MAEQPTKNAHDSTLLIVDDNITNLKILVNYLEPYGFNILTARNGEACVQKAQYGLPDLILLDIDMPGIDGFETCNRLKAEDTTNDIPVMFMTALSETEDKIRGFEVGAVDYVTKPIEGAEVLARIGTHLTISKLQHQLRNANEELTKTNDSLEQQVADRTHSLSVRAALSRLMNETRDIDVLFDGLIDALQKNFGYDHVQLYVLSLDMDQLTLAGGTGNLSNVAETTNRSALMNQDTVNKVVQTNQRVLNNNIQGQSAISSGFRSELAIPLFRRGRVQGVLALHSERANAFTDKDVSLLQSIAHELAVALDNIYLLAERDATIAQLREVDHAKSRFLALVSHELRTPLGAILGYSELLLENIFGDLSPSVRNVVEKLKQSIGHMTFLINGLLDMAQLEAGRFHVDLSPVEDIHELVIEVVEALQPLIDNKPIDIVIEAPGEIPVLQADRRRLYQILLNLGNNAVKFTNEGTITFRIECTPKTSSKIKFSVIDTGVGIAREQLSTIFEPFKSVDMSNTRHNDGLGLGLAICKQLVNAHGGQLRVKSKQGSGSEFYFSIPTNPSPSS